MSELTREQKIIRRILRVNHAGEHGAVSIYSQQLKRAQKFYPELLPWLSETLDHELSHRKYFLNAMPTRMAKPCRAMYIWKFGGAALGAITALFGKFGVMVCTAAVERTVHRHLTDQLSFLQRHDHELATLVTEILCEEEKHLAEAERHHDPSSLSARALSYVIACATEVLIFISTRGDSRRLNATMRTLA